MNKVELLEIIKKGEDPFTEFKEERNHKFMVRIWRPDGE